MQVSKSAGRAVYTRDNPPHSIALHWSAGYPKPETPQGYTLVDGDDPEQIEMVDVPDPKPVNPPDQSLPPEAVAAP